MRILLITFGSHGDVHPFVGLAQALKRRGHEVRLMTSPYFRSLAERVGIELIPIGSAEEFAETLNDPLLFHPSQGPKRVAQIASREMERAFEPIVDESKWADLVVGSSLAVSGVIAAEVFRFPYVTVHLSPICAPSVIELPTMRFGVNISNWPTPIKRTIWKLAERFMADPMFGPAINRLRAKHGLKPVKSIVSEYWHSPQLTIGLWPDWFAKKQIDHPRQLQLAGFPLYDEADVTPLNLELMRWLDAGDVPIAFTPGTAMKHGGRFFLTAIRACEILNRRGLLLTRHTEQIPKNLPAGIRHESYAPFGSLLPRVAAFVHHGGIGSTAQALRTGCPQLIVPFSHDQFDNAYRCKRLGVADVIDQSRFNESRASKSLRKLIENQSINQACREVARRFVGETPLDRACELIESVSVASGTVAWASRP